MEINGIVLSPDPRLRQECAEVEEINSDPVSYTHLTLPTNREV